MAKRNFNGSQINQSVTIAEQAGAAIDDVRNLILKYDENGDVVVATDGTAPIVGMGYAGEWNFASDSELSWRTGNTFRAR